MQFLAVTAGPKPGGRAMTQTTPNTETTKTQQPTATRIWNPSGSSCCLTSSIRWRAESRCWADLTHQVVAKKVPRPFHQKIEPIARPEKTPALPLEPANSMIAWFSMSATHFRCALLMIHIQDPCSMRVDCLRVQASELSTGLTDLPTSRGSGHQSYLHVNQVHKGLSAKNLHAQSTLASHFPKKLRMLGVTPCEPQPFALLHLLSGRGL